MSLFCLLGVVCAATWGVDAASAQSMGRSPLAPGGSKTQDSSTPHRPAPYYRPQTGQLVKEVHIQGNRTVPESKVRSYLKTRADRIFDPQLVQSDVKSLITSGLFHEVRPYTKEVQGGIVVTFEVFERPTIEYIHFVGRNHVKEKVLLRESGLKVGDALNAYSVDEARRRIEEYYQTHGYSDAKVTIMEGNKPEHRGVAFQIHEGELQRIFRTRFVGNEFVSDARLKARNGGGVQSKPGILWLFKGKVNHRQIDEDVDRLTAYYRSMGFFKAKIRPELDWDDDGKWLTLTFVIDEGPRYRIGDVRIIGNEKFPTEELGSQIELKTGDYFNLAKLRRDENALRDVYGSEGYITAKIEAEPRFREQPGELDLVYQIEEGDQYRVGRILVNIEGEEAHTRRSVVLNRLSLRPGDIVDIREIRNSERRLTASQLFLRDPVQGVAPQIVVKPAETGIDASSIANQPGPPSTTRHYRGQNPDGARQALADIFIDVPENTEVAGSAP